MNVSDADYDEHENLNVLKSEGDNSPFLTILAVAALVLVMLLSMGLYFMYKRMTKAERGGYHTINSPSLFSDPICRLREILCRALQYISHPPTLKTKHQPI